MTSDSNHAIACITVTHQSGHVMDEFLDGFERLEDDATTPVRLIVVDNASTDETVDLLRRRGRPVVAQSGNLGWGGGNNRGLHECRGEEFVLLLNPDVIVPADALERMVDALRESGAAAAVPRMSTEAGERAVALPCYGVADALFGFLGLRRIKCHRLQRRLFTRDTTALGSAYPEGSCLMLRRSVLDAVGPLDERFFLYFDDVDLDRRLKQQGLCAIQVGGAVVKEIPGKGSRTSVDADAREERTRRYLHYLDAEIAYYDKWWGHRMARLIGFVRRWIDLPLKEVLWRVRHGIRGVGQRGRQAVSSALQRTRSATIR